MHDLGSAHLQSKNEEMRRLLVHHCPEADKGILIKSCFVPDTRLEEGTVQRHGWAPQLGEHYSSQSW